MRNAWLRSAGILFRAFMAVQGHAGAALVTLRLKWHDMKLLFWEVIVSLSWITAFFLLALLIWEM